MTSFFRFEVEGFIGLSEVDSGGRIAIGYKLGRVFSMHLGARILNEGDYDNEIHAGFRFTIETQGPLSFIIDPEFVLAEQENMGGGIRIGALYGFRDNIDLLVAGEAVFGDFDFPITAGAGIVLHF